MSFNDSTLKFIQIINCNSLRYIVEIDTLLSLSIAPRHEDLGSKAVSMLQVKVLMHWGHASSMSRKKLGTFSTAFSQIYSSFRRLFEEFELFSSYFKAMSIKNEEKMRKKMTRSQFGSFFFDTTMMPSGYRALDTTTSEPRPTLRLRRELH